jgi:hypothetical protein
MKKRMAHDSELNTTKEGNEMAAVFTSTDTRTENHHHYVCMVLKA